MRYPSRFALFGLLACGVSLSPAGAEEQPLPPLANPRDTLIPPPPPVADKPVTREGYGSGTLKNGQTVVFKITYTTKPTGEVLGNSWSITQRKGTKPAVIWQGDHWWGTKALSPVPNEPPPKVNPKALQEGCPKTVFPAYNAVILHYASWGYTPRARFVRTVPVKASTPPRYGSSTEAILYTFNAVDELNLWLKKDDPAGAFLLGVGFPNNGKNSGGGGACTLFFGTGWKISVQPPA